MWLLSSGLISPMQLAEKSIKDTITRILVIFGACAGLCYNALWFFPVLMVIGGSSTAFWDLYGRQKIAKLRRKLQRRESNSERIEEESALPTSIPLQQTPSTTIVQRRAVSSSSGPDQGCASGADSISAEEQTGETVHCVDTHSHSLSLKWGILIIVGFFGMNHEPQLCYQELTMAFSLLYRHSSCARDFGESPTRIGPFCKHVSRRNCYFWWRTCCYSPPA